MSEEKGYKCPKCGAKMDYVGGLVDWECPKCGTAGVLEWDIGNKEYYVSTYEEDDIPYGCEACGGPYPDCASSCSIFDD